MLNRAVIPGAFEFNERIHDEKYNTIWTNYTGVKVKGCIVPRYLANEASFSVTRY